MFWGRGEMSGALGMFATARQDDPLPMQNILTAIMRGNGEAQAQSQAIKTRTDQMDAPEPKFSFTGKKTPAGIPVVKFEGPADLLNGTQQSDVQKSYDAPKKNVEDAISKMPQAPAAAADATPSPAPPAAPPGAPPSPGQFESNAIKSVGFQPLPTGQTAADLSTWKEDYRAQRSLGESPISAALKAGVMRTGLWNKDLIARNLSNQNAVANAQMYAKAEPILAEQDRQARLGTATWARNQAAERLSNAEQKQVQADKLGVINGTDFSLVPESDWRKTFDSANTTGIPNSEFEYRRMEQKAQRDVSAAFNKMRSDKDALATYPTADAAAKSFGHPLNPGQQQQLGADWTAARTAQQQKQANSDRADQRLAFAMREKPEKPRKLTSFDTTNASTDSLVAAQGDTAFDQTSVKQALADRRGKITARLSELDAKMKGNAVEHAKLAPSIYEDAAQTKVREGAEQANPFIYTRVMDAENKGKTWATEADTLKADLAKLNATQGTPPPANTSATDRYAPDVEARIAAGMAAAHVDRATAVQRLKAAGRLR